MKQSMHKAWGGAAAGVLIAIISVLSRYLTSGDVDPMALDGLGQALGLCAETVVMGVMGWVTVYFTPRNKEVAG